VFLNLTPDHLDRHHTLEEYGRAKARIFENQTEADSAVLNADDPATTSLARRSHTCTGSAGSSACARCIRAGKRNCLLS